MPTPAKPTSRSSERKRSGPSPAQKSPASFAFHFSRQPTPGTRSEKIVRRWEEGEINRQEANNLLTLEFQATRDVEAFSILYQLNENHFLNIIKRRLNGFVRRISPADVLQDVFILIYRYPNKFRADHDRSFYNWSYSIIINTIRRKIKKLGVTAVDLDSVAKSHADDLTRGPVSRAIRSEDLDRLKRLYSITLILYLNVYRSRLTKREKYALHLVEVLQLSYLDAAEKIGLKYDNFKMVICRARKKIFEGITVLANRTGTFRRDKRVCLA
jgi:RNA polymerase sigma factor (sigma-70 family)